MHGMRAAVLVFGLGILAACKADIPEGVFSCERDRDCPSGFFCRSEGDDDARYCYAGAAGSAAPKAGTGGAAKPDAGAGGAGRDAGADGGPPSGAGVPPTRGSFSSVGQRRSGDGLTIYDDGFESGERLCTSDARLCVTGGFQP